MITDGLDFKKMIVSLRIELKRNVLIYKKIIMREVNRSIFIEIGVRCIYCECEVFPLFGIIQLYGVVLFFPPLNIEISPLQSFNHTLGFKVSRVGDISICTAPILSSAVLGFPVHHKQLTSLHTQVRHSQNHLIFNFSDKSLSIF